MFAYIYLRTRIYVCMHACMQVVWMYVRMHACINVFNVRVCMYLTLLTTNKYYKPGSRAQKKHYHKKYVLSFFIISKNLYVNIEKIYHKN